MTMLFMDSFDHYVTADVLKKWTSFVITPSIGAASGRNGTNGIQITRWDRSITKSIGASYATHIVGAAFKFNIYPTPSPTPIFSFLDVGTNQVRLDLNAAGNLLVSRAGVQVGPTGTTVLSLATFYYIEFKVTINNTTGSFEVRINGTTEISGSGLDTQVSANASANQLLLGSAGTSSSGVLDFDDLYWCNDAGSVNNSFLGDIRVQVIFPTAEGGVIQWTPSAGTDNALLVDEAAPNDDTDYNSDATVGNRDTYVYGDLASAAASVKAIQTLHYARKDDAGTRTIAPVHRIGGVNYDQANLPNLSTSYQYLPQIVELSPATAAEWTVAEINGAEFGVKTIA